jgi:hypothetical protein
VRRLRRICLVLGVLGAALTLPGVARADHWPAGACGLPPEPTLHAEYAEIAVSPTIRDDIFASARPPLVLATSQAPLAAELRALGAHTIFWQMRLGDLVGQTNSPADPALVRQAADRLVLRAARETGCATPLIAINELQGAWLPTPWSEAYAAYRANVLALLRRMHELGAHPYLLLPTSRAPFVAPPDGAAWWQAAVQVSDLVLEVHFNGRALASETALLAGRRRRVAMRRIVERFVAAGVPAARLGLLHGFQSGRGKGGREGVRLDRWLRVVKWETFAATTVLAERAAAGTPLGSDWSWGWGDFPTISPADPDKPLVACVYLWTRDPALCDAPQYAASWGIPFNASTTEGQLLLAPGRQCAAPGGAMPAAAVDALAAARTAAGQPLGRQVALTASLQRLVSATAARIRPVDVDAAEEAVVASRFAGDATAYAELLAERGVTVDVARDVLADQLRRRRIVARLRKGVRYRTWVLAAERRVLPRLVCRVDELPTAGVVDLSARLPFLRLPPGSGTVRAR